MRLLPRFRFQLTSPSQPDYGWITADKEKYHRVTDVHGFYRALGYTEEVKRAGTMPDEFLWERYARDGAVKSDQCLQAQIAAYLHRHSVVFNNEFGPAYDELAGTCASDQIDDDDSRCAACPKHPRPS